MSMLYNQTNNDFSQENSSGKEFKQVFKLDLIIAEELLLIFHFKLSRPNICVDNRHVGLIRICGTPKNFNIIKKRLQHRCFPVNIAKFLRTPILKNICKQLHLGTDIFLIENNLS